MLKLRKAAVAAFAITVALLTSACSGAAPGGGSDGPSQGAGEEAVLDEITVASIDVDGTIPLLIAVDEGIFEKHGIKATTTMSPAFDGTLAAVMNGQAQIGFAASPPMIRAIAKDAPIRAVAQTAVISGEEAQASVVTMDPEITGPLDLIGKSVAVSSLNDLASIGIRLAVAKAGGNPDDVKLVELPGPQRLAALQEGKIDAGIFIGASALGALATEGVHLVFQYTEAFPSGSPLDMYFSRADYIEQNADLLERFRAAMAEASEFANENPDAVREHLRTLMADVPDQLAVVDELELTDYRTDIDVEAFDGLVEAMQQYGDLDAAVTAEQFFSFQNGE
ncbi:ABC transporter substrate-binding protein [Leucobacter sp. wl10]|uniref:ABC transporter substrate-binding protein n=1 Tax=Leucobacter sp. wl10 TaxID=2304677 RepID=UPI000E5B490F|nr:ABC transporter substrate-binding protein [Leucobacter sp. wl10]RGE19297.1 ABC transporter substrate-binding protein [Leucobacter sp. wl10]